jgi:hypothetical protein
LVRAHALVPHFGERFRAFDGESPVHSFRSTHNG